ncbi:MAG: 6-phosphogluconolactonase [Actinomycetota bacterium]
MAETDVLVCRTAPELAQVIATRWLERIISFQDHQRPVHLCLTGGGIGIAFLEEARRSPLVNAVDWADVHIWWSDERYVSANSSERNDQAADTALLGALDLSPKQVHSMPTPEQSGGDPLLAARMYADEIASHDSPMMCVSVLGMGPDGHVASLFPERPELTSTEAVVAIEFAPKPPPTRLSMTFTTINHADQVWVLAAGEPKAHASEAAICGLAGPEQIPAAGVHGATLTRWFLDSTAAQRLPESITTIHPVAE